MNSPIDTASEITLTVKDVQELETELAEYSQIYRDLFSRREQKEQYEVYLQGLMSDMPNKSVETMMLHLNGCFWYFKKAPPDKKTAVQNVTTQPSVIISKT